MRMSPKLKRRIFGQHFLRDQVLTEKIADETLEQLKKHGCQALLEIGPGKGALTDPLFRKVVPSKALAVGDGAPVRAFVIVEKDRKLATEWKEKAAQYQQGCDLWVLEADFLRAAPKDWLAAAPLGVVSNLPYSTGTAILNQLILHSESIPFMLLMFQKEVAQKLQAKAGSSHRGSLTLWVQNYFEVTSFAQVPPRAFIPPPKVDSEVVLLTRRKAPLVPGTELNGKGFPGKSPWEKLLKLCFSQKRKMLRSLLRGPGMEDLLARAQIDGTKRAEVLEWEEWARLYAGYVGKGSEVA